MRRTLSLLATLLVLAPLPGCGFLIVHGIRHAMAEQSKEDDEVIAALEKYRQAVLQMQTAQVAQMFEPGGQIAHENQPAIVGREAILAFLNSFADVKVLEYDLSATSTHATRKATEQAGSYRQKVRLPNGETYTAQGTFEVSWSHKAGGPWLIARMHTEAAASAPGGG